MPVEAIAGSASSTPARATCSPARNSGAASSSRPRAASTRSFERSAGSRSAETVSGSSSVDASDPDRFGSAPGAELAAGSAAGPPDPDRFGSAPRGGLAAGSAAGPPDPDRFGSAPGSASGSVVCTAFAAGQPSRRSCLRIAFSDTPTRRAISRRLLPSPRSRCTSRVRARSVRGRPAGYPPGRPSARSPPSSNRRW